MSAQNNHLVKASIVSLIQARQRSGAGTSNFTGQDVSALEGQVIAILDVKFESGAASTLDVKLQESDTVGGTYTDIAGAVFTQVGVADSFQKIALDIGNTKKFVRGVGVEAGAAPVYGYGVVMVGMPKYS